MSVPTSVVHYHDIDLATNKLINARIHPVTTAERTALASSYNSGDEGVLVFDINLDVFFVWDGNQWIQISVTLTQLQQIQEAYNRSVMNIDVTQTTTQRTVTLTYRDNTTIFDSYKFSHIHVQDTPASQWNITHNLGKFPSVSVVDSADQEVIGEVEHVSDTVLRVTFSAAFSGKVYIN
jgi:hypothetical protein